MRESRTYGFVRGVLGDWHPYRDKPSAKLSRLTGVWRHREWPRDSLGGGLFCDMLSSLLSLGFSRRFEVFVGLVRY